MLVSVLMSHQATRDSLTFTCIYIHKSKTGRYSLTTLGDLGIRGTVKLVLVIRRVERSRFGLGDLPLGG